MPPKKAAPPVTGMGAISSFFAKASPDQELAEVASKPDSLAGGVRGQGTMDQHEHVPGEGRDSRLGPVGGQDSRPEAVEGQASLSTTGGRSPTLPWKVVRSVTANMAAAITGVSTSEANDGPTADSVGALVAHMAAVASRVEGDARKDDVALLTAALVAPIAENIMASVSGGQWDPLGAGGAPSTHALSIAEIIARSHARGRAGVPVLDRESRQSNWMGQAGHDEVPDSEEEEEHPSTPWTTE